jgi:NitT/TauT family transport system substrate-binding protein
MWGFTSSFRASSRRIGVCLIGFAVMSSFTAIASAETTEVKLARQYGIHYLPLVVMQEEHLIQKRAKAAGIGDLKVTWAQLSGGASANDALLAGAIDFAAGGVGPLIQIWDKSSGNIGVKGVAAVSEVPMTLTTRNADVKSIEDFRAKDKIALPAVKTSMQAVTLQMAAAKKWGDANYQRLDKYTVSMKHPDAMAALLSGRGIDSHFTAAPYDFLELEHPEIHAVLDSFDVYGGPATLISLYATKKFHDNNPKVYKVVLGALGEAMDLIGHDKRKAAQIYLEVTKEKIPLDTLVKIVNNPKVNFQLAPRNTLPIAHFMHRIGRITHGPSSWQDMYFPEVHSLKGS